MDTWADTKDGVQAAMQRTYDRLNAAQKRLERTQIALYVVFVALLVSWVFFIAWAR